MEIKKGELSVKDILNINAGISEIINMNMDAIMMMDLGIIKASCETVAEKFITARDNYNMQLIENAPKKKNDIGNDVISAIDNQKIKMKVDAKIIELEKKTYEVQYPEFTRQELKDMIDKDKKSDDPKAFKPTIVFFANMTKFIK